MEFGAWYTVVEVVVPLVVLPLAARRHRASVALAWVAVTLVLPIAGLLAYLYLGQFKTARDRRKHLRVREEVRDAYRDRYGHLDDGAGAPDTPLARVVTRVGAPAAGRPPIGGNRVALFTDSERVNDRLVADVDAAQQHVHLLMYLYNDDATGRRVADALKRAAARGVRCRLLAGAFAGVLEGSRSIFKGLASELEQAGVALSSLRPLDPLRGGIERLDVRNHRKIAVIDGCIAWTGSQNVHDAGLHLKGGRWHQMMVRIEGPAALELQTVFAEDWLLESRELLSRDQAFPDAGPVGDVWVQTLWWGPSDAKGGYVSAVLAALAEAESRVVLTTPYFIPTESIEEGLVLAALRGVQVDLVVPARSDKPWVDAAGRAHFQALLDNGVRVHQHQEPVLHAKSISVDDRFAIVGSGNLDNRSFYLDYEASVVVYDAAFAREVREAQEVYLAASQRLLPEQWRERSAWRDTLDAIASMAGPLL